MILRSSTANRAGSCNTHCDIVDAFEPVSALVSTDTHINIEPPLGYDGIRLQLSTPHVHEQLGSNEDSFAAFARLQANAINIAHAWPWPIVLLDRPWQAPASANSTMLHDVGTLGSDDVIAVVGDAPAQMNVVALADLQAPVLHQALAN